MRPACLTWKDAAFSVDGVDGTRQAKARPNFLWLLGAVYLHVLYFRVLLLLVPFPEAFCSPMESIKTRAWRGSSFEQASMQLPEVSHSPVVEHFSANYAHSKTSSPGQASNPILLCTPIAAYHITSRLSVTRNGRLISASPRETCGPRSVWQGQITPRRWWLTAKRTVILGTTNPRPF